MFLLDDVVQRMVVVIHFNRRILAGFGGEKASVQPNISKLVIIV